MRIFLNFLAYSSRSFRVSITSLIIYLNRSNEDELLALDKT